MAVRKSPDRVLHARLKARQFALLVALAERGSLRQAASDIAVSQPAATRMLHELEQAFGVSLFERRAWGMEPNLYGETLVRHARGLLTDLSAARDEIAALAEGTTGTLRVGGVTGAVPRLLVPAVQAICRETPAVRTFIVVNATEVLAGALRAGELEAAIGPMPTGAAALDVAVEPLGHEALCIVAGTTHPLVGRRALATSALRNARWILQPPGSALRQSADTFFANAGMTPAPGLIETVSIVATLASLQAMDALSVLPLELAKHYEQRHMLVRLPLKVDGGTDYALMTRAGRELSPVASRFVQVVRGLAAPAARRAARSRTPPSASRASRHS